jgi:hypothetical protein
MELLELRRVFEDARIQGGGGLHAAVGDLRLDHDPVTTRLRLWIVAAGPPRGAVPIGSCGARRRFFVSAYIRAESKSAWREGITAMEQVPHWLEVTVFAAGMTAYAEEVDGTLHRAPPIAGDAGDPEAPPPSAIH